MKKLIVVANDIQASGKSTISRAIANFLNEQEISTLIVSSDERDVDNGFSGEFWDFNDELEVSQLIGALDRHDAVVVDVQTGMARVWADFCEEQEVNILLAEMDVEMVMVVPCNPSERANEEVADIAEIFSDQTDYVIAHLPMEAKGSREVPWKKSDAAKAVKYLGAIEIQMPPVAPDFQTAIDSSDHDIVGALDNLDSIPRFLEVQAMQWLETSGEAFTGAVDYLIPEEAGTLAGAY